MSAPRGNLCCSSQFSVARSCRLWSAAVGTDPLPGLSPSACFLILTAPHTRGLGAGALCYGHFYSLHCVVTLCCAMPLTAGWFSFSSINKVTLVTMWVPHKAV